MTASVASPSSRRAWIEIGTTWKRTVPYYVALLAEGVDRNNGSSELLAIKVKSPSSRRAWIEIGRWTGRPGGWKVALLAEGVDRNVHHLGKPSEVEVALLAEGVDRNACPCGCTAQMIESPSSRRAWIEIGISAPFFCGYPRSPSSRRAWIEILAYIPDLQPAYVGRPPRGGRG